ncbi:hypothetical protein HO665_08090 [Streptococcus suis]|nr:hypothetical protein [Streptococcus suis]
MSTIDICFIDFNQSSHGDRDYSFIIDCFKKNNKTLVSCWQYQGVQKGSRILDEFAKFFLLGIAVKNRPNRMVLDEQAGKEVHARVWHPFKLHINEKCKLIWRAPALLFWGIICCPN